MLYIWINKDVRVRDYFLKPQGFRQQKNSGKILGNTTVDIFYIYPYPSKRAIISDHFHLRCCYNTVKRQAVWCSRLSPLAQEFKSHKDNLCEWRVGSREGGD